ncbi:MAG: molybdopterin molybdotransferase MoeA [Gammaproteobacteria bacterium]|nr:molybdopterin molybdotransferase MoeA [Gammaproteobacteria bacterium]NNM01356.1 molybdopterin molybdotransferase MoeA [Gammaproteobacteria bacterium]
MKATPPDPVVCDYDPASLDADEALRRILARVAPVTQTETLPVRESLGRILAEDIISQAPVPAHTNSAVDGYAVLGADLPGDTPAVYTNVGTAFAGRPYQGGVARGETVRIMTGAPVPPECDTVIMQEDVEIDETMVRYAGGVRPGDNVRAAGEDIKAGDTVLTRGRHINAADLGLIASLGIGTVQVFRRLKIAYFSTGDELRSIGETLGPGDIYDSNRYTLYGMLATLGVEINDLGVVRDTPEALRAAFDDAVSDADVLITSGGVSVGEADFVRQILDERGQVGFWKVAMKPGRPLAFGNIGSTWFFGLPGNPVSVMVTFYQFVLPALKAMMGAATASTLTCRAITTGRLKKRPGRTEYQRGVLGRDADGNLTVTHTGDQGSGILTSMSQADCFIVLPTDLDGVPAGAWVDVQPFAGLVG